MSDTHAWAASLVSEMSEDEVIRVVTDGAEVLVDSLEHARAPCFNADDLQAVVDDVERLCRARRLVPSD